MLDEVDRMIEFGHFAELSNILERLPERPIRQTLVYSATVTINKNKKAEIKKKDVKNKSSNEKVFGKASKFYFASIILMKYEIFDPQQVSTTTFKV